MVDARNIDPIRMLSRRIPGESLTLKRMSTDTASVVAVGSGVTAIVMRLSFFMAQNTTYKAKQPADVRTTVGSRLPSPCHWP